MMVMLTMASIPVQTDLTAHYIGLLESDLAMLKDGTDHLAEKVEKARQTNVERIIGNTNKINTLFL